MKYRGGGRGWITDFKIDIGGTFGLFFHSDKMGSIEYREGDNIRSSAFKGS